MKLIMFTIKNKTTSKRRQKSSLPFIPANPLENTSSFACSEKRTETTSQLPHVQKTVAVNEMNSKDLAFRTKLKILKQRNKLWLSKGSCFDHTFHGHGNKKEGEDVTENGIKVATEFDRSTTTNLGDLLQENIKPVSADIKQSRAVSASSEKRNTRAQPWSSVEDQEMRKNDVPLTDTSIAPAPGITTRQAQDFLITPSSASLSERKSDAKIFYQARDKDKLQLNLKLFEKFRYAMNKGEVTTNSNCQNSIRPKSSPATTKRNYVDDNIMQSKPSMSKDEERIGMSLHAHAKDRKYSELRAMSQRLSHNKNEISYRNYQLSPWNIAELKVGGYSYQASKNVQRGTRERNCHKQDSEESKPPIKTKAIIVPSHTTLDCPLCGVYYDENHSFHTEYPEYKQKQNRFQSYPGPNRTSSSSGSNTDVKLEQDRAECFNEIHAEILSENKVRRPKSVSGVTVKSKPFVPSDQNNGTFEVERLPYFLAKRRSNYKVIPVS